MNMNLVNQTTRTLAPEPERVKAPRLAKTLANRQSPLMSEKRRRVGCYSRRHNALHTAQCVVQHSTLHADNFS